MKEVVKTKEKGITLVALVVTIVVLIILAGITIVYVFGDNGVFKRASDAKLQTEIAKAREKIELTFGHAKILKNTEQKYNQDNYLDDLMKSEIFNIKIKDDVVIVDGFAFEIDRSVPKIGQYTGKVKQYVWNEYECSTKISWELSEEKNFIGKRASMAYDAKGYFCNSEPQFNYETGLFDVNEKVEFGSVAKTSDIFYWIYDGRTGYEIGKIYDRSDKNAYYIYDRIQRVEKREETKGEKIGTVTSNNIVAYPDNAVQNSKWYVFKEIVYE